MPPALAMRSTMPASSGAAVPPLSRANFTAWAAARQPSQYTRGWYRLYIDTVLQADTGVDLDFLVGKSSADVTRESH